MNLSAYIPCFNNCETLPEVIASVRAQTVPVDELFVVDDGSTDGSASCAEALGVEVLRQPGNLGRGAARARAMQRAGGRFVLCVDATNVLPPGFLARALAWLEDDGTAAVFGRIGQHKARNAVERWRGRHLFKLDAALEVKHGAVLITYGSLLRKEAAESVGGFDPRLRHSEDSDLGERLSMAGWDVVFDPALSVISIARNSLSQVLERYWRWYAGKDESLTTTGFLRTSWYSIRTMVPSDLARRDLGAALISGYFPLYLVGKTLSRRLSGKRQQIG